MCATTTPCTPSRLRTPTSSTATPALIGASSSRASSPAWARPPSLAPPSSLPARTDMTSRLLPILFLSLLIGGTSVVQAQDAGTARLKDLVLLEGARSEEHTSELQSRGHLVCRLLLEKKK